MTLETLLIRDEGLRLTIYYDTVGVPTIGCGRSLAVGISTQEALYLLRNDIARVQKELAKALPWYLTLSPVRQLVIESMCFNLGLAGLLQFTNTLTAIRSGDYVQAASHMLRSRWSVQTNIRAKRLAWMMEHDAEPSF